ncbi:MAG: DUF2269 family protein [Dehalococcoidia bacterium]|nr:DUF2269 family protein [Dehalococcoidia bacterium]
MDDFDFYRLFKTLHVIAVVLLGGGFVLEAISGILAARAETVGEVRAYARLLYVSENFLSIPAAIAIAVFGYLTADRLGIELSTTWLSIGQALFYIIVILALAFLRPAANKLHRLAQAAPEGPVTPEIMAQLKQPLPSIIGPLASIAFAFIIYLMVAKPAW